MEWTATIRLVENDPNIPQLINILVDYTDGKQTVSEKYNYSSVNLTDISQIDNQIQARLAAFNAFNNIVTELSGKIGQSITLQQDSQDDLSQQAVSLDVGKIG